jgi:raffinose/stachyose/melibiose transport system permease protein
MVSKPKKTQTVESGLRSSLIKKPIKKWFPLFMGPTIICFCIGFIWPFLQGIYLSFCQFTIVTKTKFVGFENYIRAFKDPSFIHAFWYTALYTFVSAILINLFAFLFALALTQKMKGSNLFRTVFFMPNLIGGIVLSYIWSMIFDGILSKYGTSILMDEKLGFWGLIILMCWQQIGYMMIIYIAGLQAIPGDMIEAAEIDGASRWQTLIHITIPNVMSSVTICTFLSLSNGFKLFDQNLALTNGYPVSYVAGEQVSASEMLALNIYSTYMASGKYSRGTAQAKAVIFFILVAAIGLLQLKFTRKKEVQQ